MYHIKTQHIANLEQIAQQLNTPAHMLLSDSYYLRDKHPRKFQQYVNNIVCAKLTTLRQLQPVISQYKCLYEEVVQRLCSNAHITADTPCIVFAHKVRCSIIHISITAHTTGKRTFMLIMEDEAVLNAISAAITQM